MKKNTYNKDSIESLDPRTFTRLKAGVYAGDTTYATQLLVEVIANAVDEYRLGHGNKIEVTVDGAKVTVRDYGQGFLVNEKRDDDKTVLEAAFSVINTSGKYREDGVYEGTSLGSFGIGAKIVCFLSHNCEVITYRGGKYEHIKFVEGLFENRSLGKSNESSGTMVSWEASEEFFTHPIIETSKITSLFKSLVCLCPGLTITLNHNGEKEVFHAPQGLMNAVDDAVKGKELISKRLFINSSSKGKEKIDFVMTYTSAYTATIVPYVNTGLTEKGPHITAIKTTITREFNKFFRDKKWLKEKDENLTGDDIQEGAYIIFNLTAPNVSYDAQVKSTITKIDMSWFNSVLSQEIAEWCERNEKELKMIADKAINARKARDAAKKARDQVREGKKKKEKVLKFDSKLADCYSKDRSKCEIYVVEGDSASGNLKMARNNEFQAVLPVRGKILSCLKAPIEKIQKNAEIMTMIEAFGLKVDLKTMKLTYNKDDLRYGKIIIMSDADVDGSHIKNLFYTFIWSFCPRLIEEGFVYAGMPPLYKAVLDKDTYQYLADDAALAEFRKTHKNGSYEIKRFKGLGEMSNEETEILVNPDIRVLNQVMVTDAKAADKMFEDLMGTDTEPRKVFIKKHSHEVEI